MAPRFQSHMFSFFICKLHMHPMNFEPQPHLHSIIMGGSVIRAKAHWLYILLVTDCLKQKARISGNKTNSKKDRELFEIAPCPMIS